ncbi:MAG: vWA domain-containing protein [Pirellulales bacterium]
MVIAAVDALMLEGLAGNFVAELAAVVVFLLAAAAEALHMRRVARLSPLVFGADRKAGPLAAASPVIRIAAITALAWGMTTLVIIKPKSFRPEGSVAPGKEQHLLIVLDVSPSMRLEDAGPTGKQSRVFRARDLMRSFFERVPAEQYLVTVVAVYNGAKPVIVDSRDLDVVDGVLGDIPLYQAFDPGQTRLLDGLAEAAKIAKPWNPGSTTLLLLSDGDTVPPQGMPAMPASISSFLIIGVGDPTQGSFIDGRQSKQDGFALRQIATRLRGVYHDGNQHHLPSELVNSIAQRGEDNLKEPWTRREFALLALGLGGFALGLLPWCLERFGTAYRPGVRDRTVAVWDKRNGRARMAG